MVSGVGAEMGRMTGGGSIIVRFGSCVVILDWMGYMGMELCGCYSHWI